MGKGLNYHNEEVKNTIQEYTIDNINVLISEYIRDLLYYLYKVNFFVDTSDYYKRYPGPYHEISKEELKYYENKLTIFKKKDANKEVYQDCT